MRKLLINICKDSELPSCSDLSLDIKSSKEPDDVKKLKLEKILTAVENLPEDAYSQEEWDSVYRYIMGDNGGELSGRDRLIARLKYEECLRKSEEKNRRKVRTKLKKISDGGKRIWENSKQPPAKKKIGAVFLILSIISIIGIAILFIFDVINKLRGNESWINLFMLLLFIFNFPIGYSVINKVCEKSREIERSNVINLENIEYISLFEIIAYILEKVSPYIILIALYIVINQQEGGNGSIEAFVYQQILLNTLLIQFAIVLFLYASNKGNALIVFKFNSRRKSLKLERDKRERLRL